MNFETGRTGHFCRRKKKKKKKREKTRQGKADTICTKAVTGLCLRTAGNMALTNEMSAGCQKILAAANHCWTTNKIKYVSFHSLGEV